MAQEHPDSSFDPLSPFRNEIRRLLEDRGVPSNLVVLSTPPEPSFGEVASNAAFLLAREYRRAPNQIAAEIAAGFDQSSHRFIRSVEARGGFINFHLDYGPFTASCLEAIERSGSLFGRSAGVQPKRLLIEHTSVNPNKEWHVGHLRNVVIGDVLVRLARLAGHLVEVQNYIDDTGRQVAEAIAAVRVYDPPPPSDGEKYDHYVGELYVRLNRELAGEGDFERKEQLGREVDSVLSELERGDHRTAVERILAAQLETASRIGASYDLLVWESDLVRGRLLTEALSRLEESPRVFTPDEGEYKGALVIALDQSPSGGGNGAAESLYRVLVRSNGIPTYTGKDIPYMMWKLGLLQSSLRRCPWVNAVSGSQVTTTCPEGEPFRPETPDRVINVVAEHQELQQRTVIEGLIAAGYEEQARRAYHLSYGMVSQAAGRIHGRQGTGISADEVLAEAAGVAANRVREKQTQLDPEALSGIAEAVAVGAVRYLMVQYSPVKPILFDMEDVVSFEGNTGLYVQYALVRMSAVLRKAATDLDIQTGDIDHADPVPLSGEPEKRLLLKLSRFPEVVEDALRTLAVNLVAEYAYTLAAEFSQFYRDCPVLQAAPELRLGRLRLLRAAQIVLSNAASVIGIPRVERL